MTAPDTVVWAAVVLAGLGTYALRASFLFLFDRLGGVPTRLETALEMVPAAVLAPEGSVAVLGNDRLVAAALAAAVAWYTESILATIVVGLVAVVAIGLL